MNWEVLTAISGVIASAAVVISVVYLAKQIQTNTIATHSQTHFATTTALAETAANIASNNDLSEVWRKGLSAPGELDNDEFFRFALLGTSVFRNFETLYFQHLTGLVSEEFWEGHRENILWFFHRPGIQMWWKEKRLGFGKDFREFLETSSQVDVKSPNIRRV